MPCRTKKHCHVFRKDVAPDLLVDAGNPSYRDQARTTAHPTRPCHRLVTLATRSPGSSASRSFQTKNATVMLGRNAVGIARRNEVAQLRRDVLHEQPHRAEDLFAR